MLGENAIYLTRSQIEVSAGNFCIVNILNYTPILHVLIKVVGCHASSFSQSLFMSFPSSVSS